MNQRQRIKRAKQAGQMMSAAFSLLTVMQHAKPSYLTLSRGERRRVLYDALTKPWGLRLTQRAAKRVLRLRSTPTPRGEHE